jgi:tol-pal system protein YbgF
MTALFPRRSRVPYIALAAALLMALPAGAVQAGSKAEREAAERRQRQELERARERSRANRVAELLIREEEARRRRLEERAEPATGSVSPDIGSRPAPAGSTPVSASAPAADARLDQVFSQTSGWPAASRGPADYPSVIVVGGAGARPSETPENGSRNRPGPGSQPPAPDAGGPAGSRPAWPASSPDDGLELFHNGYSHFSQGDYQGARQAFTRFMGSYPGHELADSAQYWIGECAFAQGDYETAYNEYRKVVESFPFGDKVADAMLKSGYSLLELGREAEARRVLGLLVSEYPDSGAARRARERLNGAGNAPAVQ